MSKESFNQKLPTLEQIPAEKIETPNMPVAIAIQEAADLAEWAKDDKDTLVKSGLDWTLVEDLPIRTDATRYAESVWSKESISQEEAAKLWSEKGPEGFALRDELVHHFFHGFHNNQELTMKVREIAEGGSNADMVQDLSDLAVLGNANMALLQNTLMDPADLERAAPLADELSDILARANGERNNPEKSKQVRDRAYTHMKQAVDEIRRIGQYAFYRNDGRRKGYVSRYFRMANRRLRNQVDSSQTNP